MTEKQLKHLGKKNLAELAMAQENRIRQLEEEIRKKEAELQDPMIPIAEPGSLREIGMEILKILEQTQAEAELLLHRTSDGE